MRALSAVIAVLLLALPLAAQTTNNDDSCDIGVTPAATLLIPYFEVAFQDEPAKALTTIFTVTNTSAKPQIARATIWTDWAYPVLTFDMVLTGYGVAGVNLRDVIANGRLPARNVPTPGPLSAPNTANLNHATSMPIDCSERPEAVSPAMLADLKTALTTGRRVGPDGCTGSARVGSNHGTNAIGYVTIDVVATCSSILPTNPQYFLAELLFDNVLIGDWMMISPDARIGNYAGGNPMVHIRAVPEGGPAGTVVPTNLPYTFYDRLTNTMPSHIPRTVDRRQPLPVTFVARYIEGGTTDFQTRFTIWREALTGADATCAQYATNAQKGFVEIIRFDEHENSTVYFSGIQICTPLPRMDYLLPTQSLSTSNGIFPRLNSPLGDIAGWMFLNLSNGGAPSYSAAAGRDFKTGAAVATTCSRHNQNWVTTTMYAEGRYSVMADAVALANGCSRAPLAYVEIGPGANITP